MEWKNIKKSKKPGPAAPQKMTDEKNVERNEMKRESSEKEDEAELSRIQMDCDV